MNTKGCNGLNCPLQYRPNMVCDLTKDECPYYSGNPIRTKFDLIKSFDIDAMAAFMTQLCHERDMILLETLSKQGIDASLVELPFEVQCETYKRLLLEELSNS